MGSSQSQLGPGIVCADSGAFWPVGGFVALCLRETCCVRRRMRRVAQYSEVVFRRGEGGVRRRPSKAQARVVRIMVVRGERA